MIYINLSGDMKPRHFVIIGFPESVKSSYILSIPYSSKTYEYYTYHQQYKYYVFFITIGFSVMQFTVNQKVEDAGI